MMIFYLYIIFCLDKILFCPQDFINKGLQLIRVLRWMENKCLNPTWDMESKKAYEESSLKVCEGINKECGNNSDFPLDILHCSNIGASCVKVE